LLPSGGAHFVNQDFGLAVHSGILKGNIIRSNIAFLEYPHMQFAAFGDVSRQAVNRVAVPIKHDGVDGMPIQQLFQIKGPFIQFSAVSNAAGRIK